MNQTVKAGHLGDKRDGQIYVDSHGIGYDVINFIRLGKGRHFYPNQKKCSSNPDNRRGSFYFEILVLEFHQVICENSEFSHEGPELGISPFLLWIEVKLIQAKFGFFAHGQDTAVFEYDAQPRCGLCFDSVTKLDLYSKCYVDRFWFL